MKLFNDGTVPSSGSSDFDSWSSYKTAKLGGNRGVVEWDISKDEENANKIEIELPKQPEQQEEQQ